MKADLIRINRVENGYVISARPEGRVPQSYAYTDRAVAKTVDEVLSIVERMLRDRR